MFSYHYPLNLLFECEISGSWRTEEMTFLNSIWGKEITQSQLDSTHWNKHTFKQIVCEMSDKGHEKMWKQK